MKQIPLTQGQSAMVDDEDYENLSRYKWAAAKVGRIFYAVRKGRKGTAEKRTVLMHREIAKVGIGVEVDHRDCDGLNNQRSNLRAATGTENRRNRRASYNASSGLKGIWQCKGRWGATITYEKRKRHLGLYITAEDAARAYDFAAKELYGDFANVNYPHIDAPPPLRGTRKVPTSSIYKGVSYDATRGRWSASITINGKKRYFARFKVERDAALAYDAKARELLGESASLNFP